MVTKVNPNQNSVANADLGNKFVVANHPLTPGAALLSVKQFVHPSDQHLHFVVFKDETLCECATLLHLSPISLAFIPDSTSPASSTVPYRHQSEMEDARNSFLNSRKAAAPSTAAQPSTFRRTQRTSGRIVCGRPFDPQPRIPLALLHEIFAEFVKVANAHEGQPSYEALEFASDVIVVMSALYVDEKERSQKIRDVFTRYNIPFEAITMVGTEYKTDLAGKYRDFYYWLGEIKNEICGAKAECFVQATAYFIEGTRGKAAQYHLSTLPCLIVLLFGEYNVFLFATLFTTYPQAHTSHSPGRFGPTGRSSKC